MNEQEKLETQFVRAESYWNASSHVLIRSNRDRLHSLAVVQTTSGLAAKRELVSVGPGTALLPTHRYQRDLQAALKRIAPWAIIVALSAAGTAAILFLLPAWAR